MRKTNLGTLIEAFSMGLTGANKSNKKYQQKTWGKKKKKSS